MKDKQKIYDWLKKQKYQTSLCETKEYTMYYGCDMPKILEEYYQFKKANNKEVQ